MFQPVIFDSAERAYHMLVNDVLNSGSLVNPRGLGTLEVEGVSLGFDMRYPVVKSPARKLSYKFMAAEAYWILSGDNRVETIAKYNKNITPFSDDGVTFFGAYGPKVIDQLGHVVKTLVKDPFSRQAVLTIWRENPPDSKDIPCTVSLTFHLRRDSNNCWWLNTHVFMRSSDIWLGTPYDWFNFTMISAVVRDRIFNKIEPVVSIELGTQFWTTASAHLYERNFEAAKMVLDEPLKKPNLKNGIPWDFTESQIMQTLDLKREGLGLYRWTELLWG